MRALLLALLALPGCYLSHERAMVDAAVPVADAGLLPDAFVPDAGTDGGTDAGPDPDAFYFCGDAPGLLEEVGYSGCCARDGFRRVERLEDVHPAMLIVGESDDTVYYIDRELRRHVFPRADILASWYHLPGDPRSFRDDGAICASVVQVPDTLLRTSIPLSGLNVTYRPGSAWVYLPSDPLVGYVVSSGAVLRPSTASLPEDDLTCIDEGRPTRVYPVPDYKFSDYTIGEPADEPGDFDPCAAWDTTIEEDLAARP